LEVGCLERRPRDRDLGRVLALAEDAEDEAAYSDRGDQGDRYDEHGGYDWRDGPSFSLHAAMSTHPSDGGTEARLLFQQVEYLV